MALIVDTTTYSLVINSADKISGTNNNATYQVNWRDFLPDNYNTYKVAFSFQTTGGYYNDGQFSAAGTALGARNNTGQAASAAVAIGAVVIPVPIPGYYLAGDIVIASMGIPQGTTITAVNANSITISAATTAIIPINTPIYSYAAAATTSATFSSARVIMQNQGRSYSFDTQNKGPSSNLGILQRDIQLATSKSNSLSCFYCQNPPRTMARPNQNLITINIMNNYSFAGGIVSYSNLVPTYSGAVTNQNFLTDTNATGNQIATDMTGYTMLLEFIPIGKSNSDSRNGL